MTFNYCEGCAGEAGCKCCTDVFLVLNPSEVNLFKNHPEFIEFEGGGILYTTVSCPYFKEKSCQIHRAKPLYCRYYPVFITGQPFVDEYCPLHPNYELTETVKEEIIALQRVYPIYKQEWFWEDVKREMNFENEKG